MASVHLDASDKFCFFLAFVLPLGWPPALDLCLVSSVSSDSEVSESFGESLACL